MKNQNFDDDEPISEINIIPLVDIMLVLMILFLVTAPLLVPYAIAVNLAETEGTTLEATSKEPIALVINAEGILLWQDEAMDWENLAAKLAAIGQEKNQTPIHFQVDESVDFALVAQVLGLAQKYEIVRLAFITKPLETE